MLVIKIKMKGLTFVLVNYQGRQDGLTDVANRSPAGCESIVSSAAIVKRRVRLCLRYRALSMVLMCLDN